MSSNNDIGLTTTATIAPTPDGSGASWSNSNNNDGNLRGGASGGGLLADTPWTGLMCVSVMVVGLALGVLCVRMQRYLSCMREDSSNHADESSNVAAVQAYEANVKKAQEYQERIKNELKTFEYEMSSRLQDDDDDDNDDDDDEEPKVVVAAVNRSSNKNMESKESPTSRQDDPNNDSTSNHDVVVVVVVDDLEAGPEKTDCTTKDEQQQHHPKKEEAVVGTSSSSSSSSFQASTTVEFGTPTSTWKKLGLSHNDDHPEHLPATTDDGKHREASSSSAAKRFLASCAICLAKFHRGDTVCRSNNTHCNHIYHKECMTAWLLKHNECPMCRQTYLCSHKNNNNNNHHR